MLGGRVAAPSGGGLAHALGQGSLGAREAGPQGLGKLSIALLILNLVYSPRFLPNFCCLSIA